MESVKITYGVNYDLLKKKRKKCYLPLAKLRAKRKKTALKALTGIWEDKDTSFFDER